MTFHVDDACRQLGLRAGAILFREVTVAGSPPGLRSAIGAEIDRLRDRFPARRSIVQAPEVAAFGHIYEKLGVSRKSLRPSVERLVELTRTRGALPAINNVVDLYNLVSLRRLCSLGAHDLDTLALPVTLTIAAGARTYVPLGATAPDTLAPGEFVYLDGAGRVLCRLDARQADFSKVTARTRRVVLIVEATAAHDPAVVEAAFTDVTALMTAYAGASVEAVVPP